MAVAARRAAGTGRRVRRGPGPAHRRAGFPRRLVRRVLRFHRLPVRMDGAGRRVALRGADGDGAGQHDSHRRDTTHLVGCRRLRRHRRRDGAAGRALQRTGGARHRPQRRVPADRARPGVRAARAGAAAAATGRASPGSGCARRAPPLGAGDTRHPRPRLHRHRHPAPGGRTSPRRSRPRRLDPSSRQRAAPRPRRARRGTSIGRGDDPGTPASRHAAGRDRDHRERLGTAHRGAGRTHHHRHCAAAAPRSRGDARAHHPAGPGQRRQACAGLPCRCHPVVHGRSDHPRHPRRRRRLRTRCRRRIRTDLHAPAGDAAARFRRDRVGTRCGHGGLGQPARRARHHRAGRRE